MGSPNRNDPCPCGSGKKYKKCCLLNRNADDRGWSASRVASERSYHAVEDFAHARFGKGIFSEAWREFWDGEPPDEVDPAMLQLVVPWMLYHWRGEQGRTLAEIYLEASPAVDATIKDYVLATSKEPFSFYEIMRVEKGRGVALVDLLRGGDEVFVHEGTGSATMLPRMVVFGKLVPYAGVTMFDGMGSRAIEPAIRDELLRAVRSALGAPRRKVFKPEELHEHHQELISCYLTACDMMDWAAEIRPAPRMVNTDGEPMVRCLSRYRFKAGDQSAVAEALGKMERVEPVDDEREPKVFRWWKPGNAMNPSWDNTSLGQLVIEKDELRLETNSRERDTRLRGLVEEQLSGRVSFIETSIRDAPLPNVSGVDDDAAGTSSIPPEFERAAIEEMLNRHYDAWPDTPLPALRGRTPRAAASTDKGRHEVDRLLRQMEYNQAAGPMQVKYDFNRIRHRLGL